MSVPANEPPPSVFSPVRVEGTVTTVGVVQSALTASSTHVEGVIGVLLWQA